jgi:hypothetical protein
MSPVTKRTFYVIALACSGCTALTSGGPYTFEDRPDAGGLDSGSDPEDAGMDPDEDAGMDAGMDPDDDAGMLDPDAGFDAGTGCGSCDDGLPCTTDTCVDGTCVSEVTSGCLVSGTCIADGASAASPCHVCDPTVSTTTLSPLADGEDCGARSMCISSACTEVRRVFTTAAVYTPNFGGLPGADTLCAAAAAAVGLPGTFVAWLGDSTGSPLTRFARFDGPYVRVDGAIVADNFAHLTATDPDGIVSLHTALNANESGTLVGGNVFSGVDPNGSAAGGNCNNWSTTDGGTSVGLGQASQRSSAFTRAIATFCGTTAHLYCFEQ